MRKTLCEEEQTTNEGLQDPNKQTFTSPPPIQTELIQTQISRDVTATGRAKYTKEDKEALAAAVLIHGKVRDAAKVLNIPEQTAYAWTRKKWWPTLLERIRFKHQEYIEAKMSHVLELTSEALVDRLTHGDYVIDRKTGIKHRVPVKAAEVAKILGTVQDKLRVLREQPTDIKAHAVMDFTEMARDMVKYSRDYREKQDSIKGEYEDVTYGNG